jgi:hypothetical protein
MRKKPYYIVVALFMLIASGIGYRAFAKYLKVFEEIPVKLPRPLAEFPVLANDWTGRDIPITLGILKVARNDDYLHRFYSNSKNGEWVNLYIAYTARPRNMLGHEPQICYVGNGWIHDSTEKSKVTLNSGIDVPCLIHHFHRPSPSDETVTVLNYYVTNGQLSNDEGAFSGIGWRTPNIRRDASRYVAQVQISSLLESSVRNAARELTGLVLDFLPDENGNVKAARNYNVYKTFSE